MKNLLLFCIAFLAILQLNAQNKEISVNWGKNIIYDNKTNGFYEFYVGENSNGLYTLFDDGNIAKNKIERLCIFDKESKKIKGSAEIFGSKMANKSLNEKLKGLYRRRIVVMENAVHVFYGKSDKKKESLFVITFTPDLKSNSGLVKIAEKIDDASNKKAGNTDFFIIADVKTSEKILIGYEKGIKDAASYLNYKVYDKEMVMSDAQEIELPYKFDFKPSGFYTILSNGNVLLETRVSEPHEVAGDKKGKKTTYLNYFAYSLIDTPTGEINVYPLNDTEGRIILKPEARETNGEIAIEAFYYEIDNLEDNGATKMTGIFHARLDIKNKGGYRDVSFQQFDSNFYNDIYTKNIKANTSDRKKKKEDKAQALKTNQMRIENVIESNGDIFMTCSQFYEYSVEHCNKNTCYTTYHTIKGKIITFKLNSNYQMEWYDIIEREKKYNYWGAYDVNVVLSGNTLVYFYGDDNEDSESNSIKSKRQDNQDFLIYATLNTESGQSTPGKYRINSNNTKPEEEKKINPGSLILADNKVYIISEFEKIKPISNCLIMPTCGAISPAKGTGRKGQMSIGEINLE